MSVARRLAGESSGWMSFSWPDPTDRCLKGDSPAEAYFIGDVGGHVDPVEDRRVGVRVEAARAVEDPGRSELESQFLLGQRAGPMRGCIPGKGVRELAESALTLHEHFRMSDGSDVIGSSLRS